ncbi:histidine kinase [Streptomyces sp. NPDC097619]|uniref:sensor histidine kinase n=1 Tax=Streptomyces sp. NPDC097619 TaxID=3157228 RepID=UPI003323513C
MRDSVLPALLLLHVVTTYPARLLPSATALTAALTLPLLWRRRAPLRAFGAVAAAALVSWHADLALPASAALLPALTTVAAHTGRRGTLLAAAVVEAGAVAACLRWAQDGAFLAPFVALSALVVAATVLGVNVRTGRDRLDAARERAERLALRQEQQEQRARWAVAEERARITRDVHDIVTHNLSVMVALTDAAVYARHRSPDRTTAALLRISETGRQALTDMRRSLGVLRSDEPESERHPSPGLDRLAALADRMAAAGLPTALGVRGGHAHVPAGAQLTVYRLVQEALTNALKHTPAGTRATVRVTCSAGSVDVEITDTGPRPAPPATATPGAGGTADPSASGSSGHGIPGMRERAAVHGGILRAGPRPGGGWSVRTRLRLDGAGASTA